MKSRLFVICGLILMAPLLLSATTRKVLFIGNSYTFTNNMPLMLQTLASSMGDSLIYDQSDPGGYTLEQHSTYAPTLAKITEQQWDIVILQEQSELPAFPPDQVDTQVYPYAHILDSLIHANDSCTQTMFLMTWGHANGDPANCAGYPVICTYDGMQQRLRQSYLQMTQDNAAIVAPVGAAWQVMMDSFSSSIWLYISDSSHPAVPGSYLETCVLYSSIFHKRTLGCADTAGLTLTTAATIQRIADKVTMDSLYQWQQYGHYPYAGFTSACSSAYGQHFQTDPAVTANYSWNFGDGSSSAADTGTTIAHLYGSATSTYLVSLTATNACFTETLTDSVRLPCAPVGLQNTTDQAPLLRALPAGDDRVRLEVTGVNLLDKILIYDCRGVLQCSFDNASMPATLTLKCGLYIARWTETNNGSCHVTKFVVY